MNRPTAAKGPRTVMLYKGQLLVARLSNSPGAVLPTTKPQDFNPPPSSAYASGQLFSIEWEDDVRRALAECQTFDELIRRLRRFKYRIEDNAHPEYRRKPFIRM